MNSTIKNILILFAIGTITFIVGSGYYRDFQYEGWHDVITEFAIYQLYSFVLGFSNMYFFKYLDTLKWKESQVILRILVGIVGSVLITLAGLFMIRMGTSMILNGDSLSEFLNHQRFSSYTFGIWITLTIVVVFHVVYFYNKYQKTKVKESQIVAKNQTARFESLKNQLDPHFLFNSLNVLTSLIDENPTQAEKFTTKLSKVYRYVLEQKDKDLTTLEEELNFARSYMQLLSMRFEDAIAYKVPDRASDPELKIVPLSLQLLLENAVKHNVITSGQPLKVNIYEENGFLVVENTLNPKTSLGKSTKIGLSNIKHRYELVSNEKVQIEKNNGLFKVKLPVLTQKIKEISTDFMEDNAKYLRAKKRVDDLKGFYGSLVAYCIIIPFLAFLNYRTSWQFQWFWFPMFGWGIGLIFQAIQTFVIGGGWEERKIMEIMKNNNKLK